ncbi:MAG: type II secretion system protein GspC [Halioglobus sp.]
MPAQWLSSSSDLGTRLNNSLEAIARFLTEPAIARRLRQLVIALLCLWLVMSLVSLVWALYPAADISSPENVEIINPVSQAPSGNAPDPVDIGKLQSRHLFGEANADVPVAQVVEEAPAAEESRDGIEKGARETRLQLVLRGVVASTQDGLGHAIIEFKKKQAVYAVEDELPVSGKVILAKVMRRQVVLDNGGTYELLTLSEENALDAQIQQTAAPRTTISQGTPAVVDKRTEEGATKLAQEYRDRLYQNPQSLAEVVAVNAVRQDGELLGYRISPGKDKAQFSQLGFKSGDLVTSVNGINLNDPANTMRLYQTMRTASEAVFDLQRGDEAVSLSVSLQSSE